MRVSICQVLCWKCLAKDGFGLIFKIQAGSLLSSGAMPLQTCMISDKLSPRLPAVMETGDIPCCQGGACGTSSWNFHHQVL